MSTINVFRSAYENTPETNTIEKIISIHEALPQLDYDNSLIAVNGTEVDQNYILQDGDICTIRIFPKGTPGSSPLEIFLGIITLGVYTAADAIVSGATGKTIGQHVQQGLMNWLMPDASTTATNTADSLEGIPQLRGAKNQTNRNKPIPIVLGKHLYTPMFIGAPFTEIGGTDGEDQYFNVLYLLGFGKLKVNDFRLGPVSGLARNTGNITDGIISYNDDPNFCDPSFSAGNPQIELRQGANTSRPDGEVGLYPQRVVEERLNIELLNIEGESSLEVIRFSAKNPQKVQIEFTFNNGLISYNEKGEKQNASVDICLEWRGSSSGTWQEFGRIGTSGGSSPTDYNSATHTTTITRQKAKVMRFISEKTFNYSQISTAINRTIELRIIRTNTQPTDNRTVDSVYLSAIRTWCFDNEATIANNNVMVPQAPMISKYRDKTARIGFRIKATDNLQGTIDSFNCMVESYARTWDGTNWSSTETPTNNPAAVALKILQSPALGNEAYSDSSLDLNSFGEYYQWCEERNYTCNGVLTSDRRVDDLLHAVLSTGRAMRILNGNRYAVLIDKPRINSVHVLNSQNVLEAKNQKTFEDLPDGLSIKFINELDGYQETEVYVMADGSSRPGSDSKIEAMDMPFVTDYEQVIKNGRYLLACRYLRPETWHRKVSTDGYLIGIGNLVDVQDDTIVVGIGEGARITGVKIENDYITEIQTDGIFDVVDTTKLYGIKIMQFDGINPGKARTIQVNIPEPGIYSNFTFSGGIHIESTPPLPQIGDLVSFGIYDRITTPALCFGKKDNGNSTFELTLIPYQEGIYTTDSGAIPPYEANITTPQGLAPVHTPPPDQLSKDDVINLSREFAGLPATIFRLRPSAEIIRRLSSGVITPNFISVDQYSITGSGQPTQSNKTIKYKTNLHTEEQYYTIPLNVDERWEYIIFFLYDQDTLLDFEEIPVLTDGIPATIYELIPSVPTIRILNTGMADPQKISCIQRSRTGNSDPITSFKNMVYITSANTTESPYTGEITIDPSWIWIEFRLYDDTTMLTVQRVSILSDGIPASVFDILPSVQVIRKFANGVTDPIAITCRQQMTTGNNPPVESNKTIVYITSLSGQETIYTGAVKVDAAWLWIEFRLIHDDVILDFIRIPVLADGTPGTSFDVIPSVSTIRIDARGNLLPSVISCEQQVIIGSNNPIPSEKTIKYKTSSAIEESIYSGTITIDPSWKWIEFSLYDEDILLDRQRVPVLAEGRNGADAITITLLNDSKTITTDINGVPIEGMLPYTNKARLFRGQQEINQHSEFADDLQRRVYLFPSNTNVMQPMSIAMYPITTRFIIWSIPNAPTGVSIDNDGNITIAVGAELNDRNEFIVRAVYNGNIFNIIFSVMKMRLVADGVPGIPGADGITYFTWIRYADDVHGNGISNNPDGKDFIGFAYNRISPVESNNPNDYIWSLIRGEEGTPGIDGDDGVSLYTWIKYADNPDGTGMYNLPNSETRYIGISINNTTDVESDNPNDYTWSLFRGEGVTPIVIRLLDSNKSISCDMFGNPLTLPFITQASLYKGNTLITDESQLPEIINKQIVHYPGKGSAIFNPPVGSFFPIKKRAIIWSIQGPNGVSINEKGQITVAEGAALEDETQLLITAIFEGVSFTTSLNITKVYAGMDSLAVELQSESIAIPCDENGIPKPEAFPIRNMATYHVGVTNAAIPVWSLENAPAGVTINSLGMIRIDYSLDYSDVNTIIVRGVYLGIERISTLSITKVHDGVAPVTINISPDNETISYYYNGVVKPGQLPFTIKATLFKGTVEVTDVGWRPNIMRENLVLFPGSDLNRFSPLGIGVYPISTLAIRWSLENAPTGVTIDGSGTINIAANVQLQNSNLITVKAEFEGQTFTKVFSLSTVIDGTPGIPGTPGKNGNDGKDGESTPTYLGKTVSTSTSATIQIQTIGTDTISVIAAVGDYVAYVGTGSTNPWKKNYLLQWNGSQWIQLNPNNSAYTSFYMSALRDITEGAEMGVFSTLLAQKIMAMDATIITLMATLLQINNAIFAGPRFTKNAQGQLVDNGEQLVGFKAGADGRLIASNGIFNNLTIIDSEISAGPLVLSKDIPTSVTRRFDPQTNAATLGNYIQNGLLDVTGQYNSSNINRLRRDIQTSSSGSQMDSTSTTITRIYARYSNGNEVLIAQSTSTLRIWIDVTVIGTPQTGYQFIYTPKSSSSTTNNLLLQSGLWFQYIATGFTLKLLNLPNYEPEETGVIFRSGNTLMIK